MSSSVRWISSTCALIARKSGVLKAGSLKPKDLRYSLQSNDERAAARWAKTALDLRAALSYHRMEARLTFDCHRRFRHHDNRRKAAA
jgi:hypothetical protein